MKIFREPLLHFLIVGAAIFAIHGFATRHKTDKPGEILVTQGAIENLVTGFTRTWQRPPKEEELQGLLRDYIREEAAYREALALGLDRDDMIVRRRLRQKLEFLSDDLAARKEPSDEELQSFLQQYRELFQNEPRFSFRQIYFNPQLHGEHLREHVTRVRENLRRSKTPPNISNVGDPCLLQQNFENISFTDLKNTFGEKFSSAITRLQIASWQGPIESGYGTHLVYVSESAEGHLPTLAEVRNEVRREWLNQRRLQATDKFYQALLGRYSVKIEPPDEKKLAQVR